MKVYCAEVIISEIDLRGSGVQMDPYRRVTQVFTKDGELLAERDSMIKPLLLEFAEGMNTAQRANYERILKHMP